jgi:acetyltransferase
VAARTAVIGAVLSAARAAGRTLLTEEESKRVLGACGIPVVPTEVARTEEEAVALAGRLGFPAVLKLHSRRWTHKSELDGVQLDLADDDDVRQAFGRISESARRLGGPEAFEGAAVQPMVKSSGGYELILGSSYDPQFGPVLLFGSGGVLTQVTGDHATELPPLNTTLARRLVERTRIAEALRGVRGRPPVDLDRLDQILIAFGSLVIEHPGIRECDVNPLLASPEGIVALDARIVLHPAGAESALAPPAIRPYPTEYVRPAVLRDGTPVRLRPIRPEDEPEVAKLQAKLSEEAIHQRYFELVSLARRTEHRRLVPSCLTDFECEITLVAELQDSREIVALGNLSRGRREATADFGLLVADAWQKRGLGRLLLEQLIEIGRREGVRRIEGPLLSDNHDMAQLCRDLGFRLEVDFSDRTVLASLELAAGDGRAD